MTKQDIKYSITSLIESSEIVSNLVRNFVPEKSHKSIMLR